MFHCLGEPVPQRVDLSDLAFLLENLPALAAYIDREQRYCRVNRAYESFFGRPRAGILGKTISDVAGPEHHATAEPHIGRVLQGEPQRFLSTIRHADGLLRDVEVSYTPQRDDNGSVTGFLSVLQDRGAQDGISDGLSRLAAIVDSSEDAILSQTFDGILTSWNRAAERIFGYSAAEAIGKHLRLILPAEKWEEEQDILAKLRRGEHVDTFETERRTKDGRTVFVSVHVSPVRNAQGQLIGASKIARDITRTKRTEQALRASEEYLRAVLASMPDSVSVVDRNGILRQINPAGAAMIEAESDAELIGKCLYQLLDKEYEQGMRALNDSVFEGGAGGRLELAVRRLNGVKRVVETSVVPLRGAADEVMGALAITRDVTSREQSERRDAFLLRLDDETRSLTDPREITAISSQLLCEHLGADRCSYAEIDIANGTVDIMGNYSTTLPGILGRYELASFGEEFRASMQAGRPYVFRDAARELPANAFLAYQAIGIAAVLAIPLVKRKVLVAGMGVHQSTPRNWSDAEIALVGIVANRCWESIERARVERELRAGEALFRSIVEAAAEGIWIIDVEGRTTFVNPRMTELLGYQANEMLGRSCFDFMAPEDKEKGKAGFESRKGGGDTAPREYQFMRQDGTVRWLSFLGSPMYDASGKLKGVLAMCTDTTERRRVDERVHSLNAELTAKLREVETLLRVAPVGIAFSYDTDCRTVIFNPAAQLIFGTEGKSNGTARDGGPPYRVLQNGVAAPEETLPLQRAAKLGIETRDVEYEIVRRDGRVVQVLCSASPVHDGEGNLRGSVAALLDITERKNAENSLRRANTALEQFAYAAAHDLQEPARNVAIYTHLLALQYQDRFDATGDEYAKCAVEGAHRMQTLIQDLLSYARATNDGEDDLHPDCDAEVVLAEVIQNLRTAIEVAGAEVSAEALPRVVGVRHGHFVQLLQNLVSNSLKYHGAQAPVIRISAVQQASEFIFAVTDKGIGISPAFHDRIFGVFKRLHGREIPGTGIGLAICERIVSYYGGSMWVESEIGKGASFYFTLPAGRRAN